MGFFESINPFSYVTPVYADASPIENSPISTFVAADPVEVEATMIDVIEPKKVVVEVEEEEEKKDEGDDDEEEEEEEEDEDEEEEAEDPAVSIREACSKTMTSKALYHHYEECAARVEEGSKESCAEEFLHFMHEVDKCAADKIFKALK